MKKQYLVIIISLFILACGGNAKNSAKKKVDNKEIVEEQEIIQLTETEVTQKEEKVELTDDNKETEQEPKNQDKTTKTIIVKKELEGEIVGEIIETSEKLYPTLDELRPNHETWSDLLKIYVTSSGKVNYKEMKVNLSKIKTYLEHLEKISPQSNWSKNEKLAYWINLYNASTVYLVSSNYPVSSITKINGGKPWDKKFVKSGNEIYSLNDIENKIVRPQFNDPRIHAALNCAAKSCPKLLNKAFISGNLNTQLDKQVRAWINDTSKNKLEGDKAQISQIFDWYKADFKGGVIAFINQYISTNIALQPNAKITYLEYNWDLNE